METTPAEVREFILERVRDPLRAKGLAPREVPGLFDLLLEGAIDSFGIVELIAALEQRFELEFDFDELAADDMTRIGPLSSYVAGKMNGARLRNSSQASGIESCKSRRSTVPAGTRYARPFTAAEASRSADARGSASTP